VQHLDESVDVPSRALYRRKKVLGRKVMRTRATHQKTAGFEYA
jgi:hypothetical protein